jgi:hypothetical protein
LRESGLGLACLLLIVTARAPVAGVQFVVELGLLLVEVLLFAIPDRLLAVTEGLFQSRDALIGVEVLLRSVWHAFTSPV